MPGPVLAAAAPEPGPRLALVLAGLVLLAVVASLAGRLGAAPAQVSAAARAVVQLAAVSLVLTAALGSPAGTWAFVAVMLLVASLTSARRIGVDARGSAWVLLAIAAGAAPVLVLVLGSGVVPFNGLGIIPVAGIVIGNAMTAATLTGRRASDEIAAGFGSYEAGLALGLPSPAAAVGVIGPAGREALVPGLDQTRTVGLVTLPGAFIGVLLGGGSPVQAGAAQVLVLLGVMAAQAWTAAVLLRLVATARVVRSDLVGRYPR